jgi:MinD superfamily P-loop ATPase
MVRALGVPFGVVLNRDGAGDNGVDTWCRAEGIEILARIPESRPLAEAYSRGTLAVWELPELTGLFQELWQKAATLAESGSEKEGRCAS